MSGRTLGRLHCNVLQSLSPSADDHLRPKLIGYSRLQVIWFAKDGTETILADTTEGYRVLETTSVLLPPSEMRVELTLSCQTSPDILPPTISHEGTIPKDLEELVLRGAFPPP